MYWSNPTKKRDECKLMMLDKKSGDIQHKKFKDITDLFNKGDVLVLNNTKVFSTRFMPQKKNHHQRLKYFYCVN